MSLPCAAVRHELPSIFASVYDTSPTKGRMCELTHLQHGGRRDEKGPGGRRRPPVQEQDLRNVIPTGHRGGVSEEPEEATRRFARVPTRPAGTRPELRPLRAADALEGSRVGRDHAGYPHGR